MPQIQFPFFPEGVTHITSLLAFARRDGQVTYFDGSMPVFLHAQTDLASLRMITAQFVVSGHATQAQIARAFGVAKISVKRGQALPRAGAEGVLCAEEHARGGRAHGGGARAGAALIRRGAAQPRGRGSAGDQTRHAIEGGACRSAACTQPRQRQRGTAHHEQE
jgi:hypothetical protein